MWKDGAELSKLINWIVLLYFLDSQHNYSIGQTRLTKTKIDHRPCTIAKIYNAFHLLKCPDSEKDVL